MKTRDIWLTGYIMSKGIRLKRYTMVDKSVTFEFDLTEEEFSKLKVEFVNSDELKVKHQVDKLKDMING